jgi:hypothetical protein
METLTKPPVNETGPKYHVIPGKNEVTSSNVKTTACRTFGFNWKIRVSIETGPKAGTDSRPNAMASTGANGDQIRKEQLRRKTGWRFPTMGKYEAPAGNRERNSEDR